MPEVTQFVKDKGYGLYRKTLECQGHGFSSSCRCKEALEAALEEVASMCADIALEFGHNGVPYIIATKIQEKFGGFELNV